MSSPNSEQKKWSLLPTWILSVGLAIVFVAGSLYAIGLFLGMTGGETWMIGYYGKFNRVRGVIEKMPDIRILDTWQHHDVILEDFGFTIVSSTGRLAKVKFMEDSPEMKMTKSEEIQAYIRASLANPHF